MKFKHIILLFFIFLGLLAMLFAKKILLRPEVEISEYKSLAISLNPSDIYAIEIKNAKDGESLRFEKKDEEWFIPSKWNMKAKKDKIGDFIKAVEGIQGELRSSSKKLLPDFGISDDEAYSIVISDKEGGVLQSFFIGVKKPGFGRDFLRKSGSFEVYLVDKDIFSLIGIYQDPQDATINIDNWMDLSIPAFDEEKIDSVKIVWFREGESSVGIALKKELDEEKKLKEWRAAMEKEHIFDLDAKKIKDFLGNINTISAKKALDPEGKDYGFDKPFLTVTLGSEGNPIEFVVGNTREESEDRYVKISEGGVYIINKYNIEKLDVDISKFFINNPFRIEDDKLRSLSIKSGKKVVKLDKGLITKNTDYVNKLKEFSVDKMLLEEKYAKTLKFSTTYSLKIEKEDGSIITIDVEKEKDGRFIAQLREKPGIFVINQAIFENIFEGLDKLDVQRN